MTLRTGDSIDRFSIEALLGEGGMGEVYRAHDPRLQRKVALKVVRVRDVHLQGASSGGVSSDGTARILREARAAGALDHPNAVAIFDVGETDGTAWLAMELIEGSTLRTYVGDATVPIERRIRWLTDVARALGAAHRRGLVHRDIKPENVMVRDDGVVKVLDFGIARRTSAPIDATAATTPEGLPTITQEGAVIGTPLYMAPEQLKGEPLDGRADQFAWGVMAYELLAGFTPWREALAARGAERNAYRLVAAILTSDPEPLAKVAADVPPEMIEAIARAMSKKADARFATMDDLVVTLGVSTHTSSLPPALRASARAPTPKRRSRLALPLLAIGAALIAATVVVRPWNRSTSRSLTTAVASSAATSAEPSAITDYPLPPTSVPNALTAYRAGMQGFRDGASAAWAQQLTRAAELDPSMAAAHLRLAWILQSASMSAAREHFAKATLHRSALSAHDQALLEACAPFFQSAEPDHAEIERRLADADARFPRDAELSYFLGAAHADRGDFVGAVKGMVAAIDADPKFAMAWAFRAIYEAYLDDVAGAERSLAACLDAVPGATLCLHFRGMLGERAGACARVESDARRMIAIDPQTGAGYGFLAEALYAQGGGIDAARETLRQQSDRASSSSRREAELTAARKLAEITGDFASAEASAREIEKLLEGRDDNDAHAAIAAALVAIYDESGRAARAGEVARDYLARRAAWVGNPRGEDYAVVADVVPAMLAAEARAGIIDAATFEAKRAEWLARWKNVLAPAYTHTLWIQGVASLVQSPKDAASALDALSTLGPPHAFSPLALDAADRGHVYLLAGRVDDAVVDLARASRTCVALASPIAHTRAVAWLGDALASKGDKLGACAAYKTVLDRWGHAKPKSVTADRARARGAALACPR